MDEKLCVSQEVELRKCAEDFVYFCENYVKIIHPVHGLVSFTLYPYQKRYVKALQDNRLLICKKFRQGGFTTLNCAWALWKCMFCFDKTIMICCPTDRHVTWMHSPTIDKMLNELPDWLKPKMAKQNDHQKHFEDTRCKIFIYKLETEKTRGRHLDYVFIDEAAFIANMDKHWKEIYPTITAGGKCCAISSTNGTQNNWFHDIYTAAEKMQNNFKIFHCNYLDHPDYSNLDWAVNMKQNLGAKGWRQEILCEFLEPDNRTSQQKMEDTLQFFDDITAAEELVQSLNKCEETNREKTFKENIKKIDNWHEDFKIGEDLEQKGLDWKLETIYTEDPKPLQEEVPQYKPQAYQFRTMTREEQRSFISGYEARHVNPVGHPEFEKPLNINDLDSMVDFWSDVSEIYPQYEDVKECWIKASEESNRIIEETENQVNQGVSGDILALAGIISAKEAKTIPVYKVFARPDLKIIDTIRLSGRYSKDLNLSFYKDRLCVNKIPTVIKEDDVRDLYNGIFSLVGYEQAIEAAVNAITSKLDSLFLEEKDAESLEEKTLK